MPDDDGPSLGDHVAETKREVSAGKSDRTKSAMSAAGGGLQRAGQAESDRAASIAANIRPVAYKKGGKVRKGKRGKGRRKAR